MREVNYNALNFSIAARGNSGRNQQPMFICAHLLNACLILLVYWLAKHALYCSHLRAHSFNYMRLIRKLILTFIVEGSEVSYTILMWAFFPSSAIQEKNTLNRLTRPLFRGVCKQV